MAQGALPGFRDFYPDELARRAYILVVWHDVLRRYAFVEYDGPPLEPLGLYRKKSGRELVGQIYSFKDRRGREPATTTREKLEAAVGSKEIADRVEEILSCRDVASLVQRYSEVESAAHHIERMRQYLEYVSALGFGDWVQLDLSIVRGL